MSRFLDLDGVRAEMKDPFPFGRTSARQLGEHLARLVWESFSDYLTDPETLEMFSSLRIPVEDGLPPETAAEELLIFHMWVHSRALQLSFFQRVPESTLREVLDHLHRAVFEDMVANGTERTHIPVFEQRVGARYASYYPAAESSDESVGNALLDHLVKGRKLRPAAAGLLLTARAVEMASPLRDFLDGVDLQS